MQLLNGTPLQMKHDAIVYNIQNLLTIVYVLHLTSCLEQMLKMHKTTQ